MGADGGVVYIPLKKPTTERYARVIELISPFWQFLSRNGGSSWGEDANWEWEQDNSIGAPEFLLGYYGTDRGDSFDLKALPNLCEADQGWMGNLHILTFDELDLDCRTSPFEITNSYNHHPLHRLWHSHFHYDSREEVLEQLGPLASMTIEDWATELDSLLDLRHICREETWT